MIAEKPLIQTTYTAPIETQPDSVQKRIIKFLLRKETLLIVGLLCIAGAAHAINMFHFPYFEDDEGTYLSQAWAVIFQGRLAYYTYWYDHAPVGWFQIALWTLLTGGFHTFGSSLYSGRIFMLLLQLGSTLTLYYIAKKISRSVLVGLVVGLLFALSPYGIYYHRRVLLDNLTTLPLLLSILCLVVERLKLKYIWLSAVFFSIAVLSKEITAFVLPALLCLVIVRTDKSNRLLAATGWIVLVVTLISLYPLMALINSELFPSGTVLGGSAPHVSLLQGISYQASRGGDGGILNFHSLFWIMTRYWVQDDPLLVVGGTSAAVLSLLTIKKYPVVGIMGLCSLCFWLYFMHGGEVIKFYMVPLLPLLALNLGLFLWIVTGWVSHLVENRRKLITRSRHMLQPVLFLLCIIGLIASVASPSLKLGYSSRDIGDANHPLLYWTGTQADAQIDAINWVTHHVPKHSRIVIDMSMWPDLHDQGYDNAHYYWKVETDSEIRDGVFHNDWHDIDYVILSPQMEVDEISQNMTLLTTAQVHATPVISFDTGGWPIKVLKVNKTGGQQNK